MDAKDGLALARFPGSCSLGMCCPQVTRLQFELILDVIESPERRQNISGVYKSGGKIKIWKTFE